MNKIKCSKGLSLLFKKKKNYLVTEMQGWINIYDNDDDDDDDFQSVM